MVNERIKALPDDIKNIGFNAEAQELFVQQRGIYFEHFVSLPSPIGLVGEGEYRRSLTPDTISENGYIYKKAGNFIGVLLSNSKNLQDADGGMISSSHASMVLPKYYSCGTSCPIAMLPGDRLYCKDLQLYVSNYQRMTYNVSGIDVCQYPIVSVCILIDSYGKEYKPNIDFTINSDGNIKWSNNNPGINPDTGKGNVYSIRYKYVAYYIVDQLLNEIRISNEGEASQPMRLPQHVSLFREYIFHNKNRSASPEAPTAPTARTIPVPEQIVNQPSAIQVDMSNFNLEDQIDET